MRLCFTILFLFFSSSLKAQLWTTTAVSDMPEPVSNNAVCEAKINGTDYMFSFAGIDTTKVYSGIHLKTYRYNSLLDSWITISPLPDTLGKVAASASYVKDKIYIIGGYHVYADGSEKSSSKVHIYNPATNNYLPNGADIPFPIDDQVQCVWRDSLIYVISGWSNSGNVGYVQVYNPAQNTWQQATPVSGGAFEVFGANGVIRNDTIYYYGGANMGSNFPATPFLRIGIIDSLNPLSINWLAPITNAGHPLYRMCALANPNGTISFLGGSSVSYNYNGISYAMNQGVPPANEQILYNPGQQNFVSNYSVDFPMDLRGYADMNPTTKFICGGMEANQEVSKKAYRLDFVNALSSVDLKQEYGINIYPNPIHDFLMVSFNQLTLQVSFSIVNTNGQKVTSGVLNTQDARINLGTFAEGTYFIVLDINGERIAHRFTKGN